jgi:hypothetical protein
MNNEKYLTNAEALDVEVASLRLLQQIAEEESVKIEELTPAQIIAWFERDAELKRSQGDNAGSLQW